MVRPKLRQLDVRLRPGPSMMRNAAVGMPCASSREAARGSRGPQSIGGGRPSGTRPPGGRAQPRAVTLAAGRPVENGPVRWQPHGRRLRSKRSRRRAAMAP